jgi:hypothetical protein
MFQRLPCKRGRQDKQAVQSFGFKVQSLRCINFENPIKPDYFFACLIKGGIDGKRRMEV